MQMLRILAAILILCGCFAGCVAMHHDGDIEVGEPVPCPCPTGDPCTCVAGECTCEDCLCADCGVNTIEAPGQPEDISPGGHQ